MWELAQIPGVDDVTQLAELLDSMSLIGRFALLEMALMFIITLLIVALIWNIRTSSRGRTEDSKTIDKTLEIHITALSEFKSEVRSSRLLSRRLAKIANGLVERIEQSTVEHHDLHELVTLEGRKTRAFVKHINEVSQGTEKDER